MLPTLNNQKIVKSIVDFLKREFKKRKKTGVVVGVSGGLDSTAVAFLCKKAKLDLYLVYLPRGKFLKEEKILKIINILNLPQNRLLKIDISPIVDAQIKEIKKKTNLDKIDIGNIIARTRMVILYAFARKFNGLVVGTGNLSEYLLGYFTLHGDGAADIFPLLGLFKTRIYELAKYLGVPEEIIGQEPSAELWRGQTDAGELGFSYRQADPILYLSCIKKYSKKKIIKKYNLDKNLVSKVLERVKRTEYKRELVPSYKFPTPNS